MHRVFMIREFCKSVITVYAVRDMQVVTLQLPIVSVTVSNLANKVKSIFEHAL